jgi:feruloyl-CoA synthase
VSPTIMNTVPAAWNLLAPALENEPEFARKALARVVHFSYGGASLSRDVFERIERVAETALGARVLFTTGLGATETCGMGVFRSWMSADLADLGAPGPGSEVKLVPLEGDAGRYEIRVRGAYLFKGYVKRPDLTAAAFDEEGFFRLGDAVHVKNPADPREGMRFDGRVVEDFKLASGTWVRTGAVRLSLIEACAPLISDAVICGHDHDFVAALAWPHVAACQNLMPELAGLTAVELVRHPTLVAAITQRLRAQGGNAAGSVRRVMLMAEPPLSEAGEIADKGYVNQAATRARRAPLVLELLATAPGAHIAKV